MKRVDEVTLENQLLWERVSRPSPLAGRRSKKCVARPPQLPQALRRSAGLPGVGVDPLVVLRGSPAHPAKGGLCAAREARSQDCPVRPALLGLIKADLSSSPFQGGDPRKVWARRRVRGRLRRSQAVAADHAREPSAFLTLDPLCRGLKATAGSVDPDAGRPGPVPAHGPGNPVPLRPFPEPARLVGHPPELRLHRAAPDQLPVSLPATQTHLGVAERFNRTHKKQVIHGRVYHTPDNVRVAVAYEPD